MFLIYQETPQSENDAENDKKTVNVTLEDDKGRPIEETGYIYQNNTWNREILLAI